MNLINASAAPAIAGAEPAVASITSADLTANIYTFTHNLGVQYPIIQVSDENGNVVQPDSITFSSTTAAAIDLTSFATISGTWHAEAVG